MPLALIKMKNTFYKHIFVTVALILLLVFCFPKTASSRMETTAVYFHCSETSINNFKSLKMEFDRYLSQFGPYEFQPVKERYEFEKQISNQKNCVILVSSWHYRRICKTYQCEPVLVGIRNGKNTQKRLLIANKDFTGLISSGLNIASASSIQHTTSVIKNMPVKALDINKLRILTVPKDIDAMMAVRFGMSGAALITENSYDRLKRLTPLLYQKIKIVAIGNECHLMVLAAPGKNLEQHKQLIRIIKGMSDTPLGQKQIHMLGLDNFQDVTNEDRMMLKVIKNITWKQEKE
jgi:hypothetical protein